MTTAEDNSATRTSTRPLIGDFVELLDRGCSLCVWRSLDIY